MSTPLSFEHLVAFVVGELDARQRSRVEAELSQSPELAHQVAEIGEVIATMQTDKSPAPPADVVQRAIELLATRGGAPAPSVVELGRQVARFIAELIFDTRRHAALAGFRGSSSAYQLAYGSKAARIDLQLSPASNLSDDQWRIRGQITPLDDGQVMGVRIQRLSGGGAAAHATPDHRGRFAMTAQPGMYDLVVRLTAADVVVEGLEIG